MEKQFEKAKRLTVYLTPETEKRLKAVIELSGGGSQSYFVNRAIDFYSGYISAQEHQDFLASVLSQIISGTIKTTETRLARLHFKTTVELAKLAHTVASLHEIDDETLRRLHIRCVDEVKRINGVVKFEDAMHYQHSDD